jgi:hypothetical protein
MLLSTAQLKMLAPIGNVANTLNKYLWTGSNKGTPSEMPASGFPRR